MNMTIDCKVLCSPNFNTRYIKENASWVPPSGRESISIDVQQSEGGPPASAQLPISVRAVDRAPQVRRTLFASRNAPWTFEFRRP